MMQRLLKLLRGRMTAFRGAWWPSAGPMVAGLAMAWLLGWVPAQAQERPPEGPANVVNLMATAYQEVAQDRLVLQMSVTREGSDAAQVQTQIRQALDDALKLARPHERALDMEVGTGDFSLNPRYAKDGRIATWVGSAQLVLEGRDFELIARTAGQLTSLTMAGSHFTLSRQARQALEADVQRAAIERFRARADDIARSFGFTGYTLREVSVSSTDSGGGMPRPMMMAAAKSFEAEDAAIPVEAGRTTVQVTVSGSIQLR